MLATGKDVNNVIIRDILESKDGSEKIILSSDGYQITYSQIKQISEEMREWIWNADPVNRMTCSYEPWKRGGTIAKEAVAAMDALFENAWTRVLVAENGKAISGVSGNNVFVLFDDWGTVTINNQTAKNKGTDTLLFANVSKSDIAYETDNKNNLIIYQKSKKENQVILNGYLKDPENSSIKNMQFGLNAASVDDIKSGNVCITDLLDSNFGIKIDTIKAMLDADPNLMDYGNEKKNLTLTGTNLKDIITGGDGNDKITANQGDDTITGGKGNDTLSGVFGNNTFIFNKGDGNDIVVSQAAKNIGVYNDTLNFADVDDSSKLSFTRSGNDLVVHYGNLDTVTIQGYYTKQGSSVKYIKTQDSEEPDEGKLIAGLIPSEMPVGGTGTIKVTDNNQTVLASGGNDTINVGGAKNITVNAGRGNDTINSEGNGGNVFKFCKGSGNDTIVSQRKSGTGTDTLEFTDSTGFGTDMSFAASGNDLIIKYNKVGDEYKDSVTLKNYLSNDGATCNVSTIKIGSNEYSLKTLINKYPSKLEGASGVKNKLNGSKTSDVIIGKNEDDTIVGNGGDDIIIGNGGKDTMSGTSGNNAFVFFNGDGIDYVNSQTAKDKGTDTLVFANAEKSDISFARSGNTLIIKYNKDGDDAVILNDYFKNPSASSVKNLQFGLDNVSADKVKSGNTNLSDLLKSDNDTLQGLLDEALAAGKVTIGVINPEVKNTVQGTNDTDIIIGGNKDDKITANQGNDTITGGKGNDTLSGVSGNNTFIFNEGDGNDIVVSQAAKNIGVYNDTLNFAVDNTSKLRFTRSGNDLVVHYGDLDTVTIQGYYSKQGSSVKYIKTQDSEEPDEGKLIADLIPSEMPVGGTGTIKVTDNNQTVLASGGNDTINVGKLQNITVNAGRGNDTINSEGNGGNVFKFYKGSGNDTIVSQRKAGTGTGNDILEFADSTGFGTDMKFTASGNDLIISYGENYTDSVKLKDYLSNNGATSNVLQIKIGDNEPEYLSKLLKENTSRLEGTSGVKNKLNGSKTDDVIIGKEADDTIVGNGGGDIIIGNKGNDTLSGTSGNNAFVFFNGDGNDIINSQAKGINQGKDTIVLADVSSLSEVDFEAQGNNLVIRYNYDSTEEKYKDSIVVKNYLADSGDSSIKYIQFGTPENISDASDIKNMSDVLYPENQVPPRKRMYLEEAIGINPLIYEGNKTKANGNLKGSDLCDIMIGGELNDTINSGYGGDDIVAGGKGSDKLYGSSRNTFFVFFEGDGTDYVYNIKGGLDEDCDYHLVFANAKDENDLMFIKNGNNLEIQYSNKTDDKVIVTDYFKDPSKSQVAKIQFGIFDFDTHKTQYTYQIDDLKNLTQENFFSSLSSKDLQPLLDGNLYITGNKERISEKFSDWTLSGSHMTYKAPSNCDDTGCIINADYKVSGNDFVCAFGGNGDDTINCSSKAVFAFGGAGDDTYNVNLNNETVIFDNSGNDVINLDQKHSDVKIMMDISIDIYGNIITGNYGKYIPGGMVGFDMLDVFDKSIYDNMVSGKFTDDDLTALEIDDFWAGEQFGNSKTINTSDGMTLTDDALRQIAQDTAGWLAQNGFASVFQVEKQAPSRLIEIIDIQNDAKYWTPIE